MAYVNCFFPCEYHHNIFRLLDFIFELFELSDIEVWSFSVNSVTPCGKLLWVGVGVG